MNELWEESLIRPTDKEDLKNWVKTFLNIDLQTCIRCTKENLIKKGLADEDSSELPHSCQLDYVASCFFEEHSSSVQIANRGGGKSYTAAIVIILDSWFRSGIKNAVLGYKKEQAHYIHKHIEDILPAMAEVFNCKVADIADILKDKITFYNESVVRFYTGIGRANIKGFHPERLWVDEADLFSFEEFDGLGNALVTTQIADSQFNILSTSYQMNENSVILRMEEQFKEFNKAKPVHMKPNKTFRICLLDVLETCDKRYKCFNEETQTNCILWEHCKGLAKDIKGGFYPIDEAIKKMMSNSSSRTFESEQMLKTPLAENAYFPSFGKAHLSDIEMKWNPNYETYVGWDFGGVRCPHAVVITQKNPFDNCFEVIAEYESKGNLEDLINQVKRDYPGIEQISRCFIDNSSTIKIAAKGGFSYKSVLEKAGWICRHSSNCKRADTFELLLSIIHPADGKKKLRINKSCKSLIHQIRCAKRKSDGKPEDGKGDDLLDCFRYILYWAIKKSGGGSSKGWRSF